MGCGRVPVEDLLWQASSSRGSGVAETVREGSWPVWVAAEHAVRPGSVRVMIGHESATPCGVAFLRWTVFLTENGEHLPRSLRERGDACAPPLRGGDRGASPRVVVGLAVSVGRRVAACLLLFAARFCFSVGFFAVRRGALGAARLFFSLFDFSFCFSC